MKFFIMASLMLSSLSSFSNDVDDAKKCHIGSLSVNVEDGINYNYQDAIRVLRTKGYEIDLNIPTIEMRENGFRDTDTLGRFGKLSMFFGLNKLEMQQQMQAGSALDVEAHVYNAYMKSLEGFYYKQAVYRNTDLVITDCNNSNLCYEGKKYTYTEREYFDLDKKILGVKSSARKVDQSIIKKIENFPTCKELSRKRGTITGKNYTLSSYDF